MLKPAPMAFHDQKCNVASHFDILDLRNENVSLVLLLISHDADVGTNGIAWPNKSYCTLFQSSWPKKWNVAIDDAVGTM